ncbi:hypothetical protein BDV93DRAFT_517012, partial [Ceratobasidium sp. AG-I]
TCKETNTTSERDSDKILKQSPTNQPIEGEAGEGVRGIDHKVGHNQLGTDLRLCWFRPSERVQDEHSEPGVGARGTGVEVVKAAHGGLAWGAGLGTSNKVEAMPKMAETESSTPKWEGWGSFWMGFETGPSLSCVVEVKLRWMFQASYHNFYILMLNLFLTCRVEGLAKRDTSQGLNQLKECRLVAHTLPIKRFLSQLSHPWIDPLDFILLLSNLPGAYRNSS